MEGQQEREEGYNQVGGVGWGGRNNWVKSK